MAAKAARHDANHIIDAVTSALRHGALPGENGGFNEEACEDAARFLAGAIRIRAIGEPIIALETLKGVGNRRLMRLAVINDDMPFLVDSVAAPLSAEGIAVHRLIHPVVSVVRDEKGVLTSISPSGRDSTQHESIIYFEPDRADARRRRRLLDNVLSTLAEVRAAVADWPRLQQALRNDLDTIPDTKGAAWLGWFLDRQIGRASCRERACKTG